MIDRWSLVNQNDERLLLSQFLRFAETRSIAYQIVFQQALQHAATLHSLACPDATSRPTAYDNLLQQNLLASAAASPLQQNVSRCTIHSSPTQHVPSRHVVQPNLLDVLPPAESAVRPEVIHAVDQDGNFEKRDKPDSRDMKQFTSACDTQSTVKSSEREVLKRALCDRQEDDSKRQRLGSHVSFTSRCVVRFTQNDVIVSELSAQGQRSDDRGRRHRATAALWCRQLAKSVSCVRRAARHSVTRELLKYTTAQFISKRCTVVQLTVAR
jgi:hypothetical protein